MKRFYVHRVLAADLPCWLAVGWRVVSRTRCPSVADDIVLIRLDATEAICP